MEIQFPYECPRCGARGELRVNALSLDPQRVGVPAAQRRAERDVRELRPLLRCPGCGKRPRAWIARLVATVLVGAVLSALAFCAGHTLGKVMAPVVSIVILAALVGQVKRAGKATAIRLAAPLPEARAIAVAGARPPSGAEPPEPPEPGAGPRVLV